MSPRVDLDSPVARRWLATLAAMHPDVIKNDPRSVNALAIYDLVYATAFAIARTGPRSPTGANIAAALRDLNRRGAPEVPTGPDSILPMFERVHKAEPVDIRSGSGRLDWDEHGDVLQDIDVMCLPRTAAAAVPAEI